MFFKRDVVLAQEYLGFLLLNVFDLFLTGYIFRHQGHEGNQAANWILGHFGLSGFALYKFILVTVVVLACEGISLRHMRRAKQVVLFGAIIMTLVVCYEGVGIIVGIHMKPPEPVAVDPPMNATVRLLPIDRAHPNERHYVVEVKPGLGAAPPGQPGISKPSALSPEQPGITRPGAPSPEEPGIARPGAPGNTHLVPGDKPKISGHGSQ